MRFPEVLSPDRSRADAVQHRLDTLTKPVGSLGMLEDTARRLALIQGTLSPRIAKKRIYVFAADHGIADEGVSAYPSDVTAQMVLNFLAGGAAINVFARQAGAEVFVVDAGVKTDIAATAPNFIVRKEGRSTKSFLREPAMTRDQAEASLVHGFDLAREAARDGVDVLVLGDMGIGNTTTATAVASAAGVDGDSIIDIGTVIDSATLRHKRDVILRALELHRPDSRDALDILAKVGGFCIAEMTGMILQAAALRIPVVLDGYPVTSAALLAHIIDPGVVEYLFAGHLSAVKGHKVLLDRLGLKPLVQLGMRLGEGTGAALALMLMEASTRMMNEMATFESAGVSKGDEEKIPR